MDRTLRRSNPAWRFLAVGILWLGPAVARGDDPLPSWNEGPARRSIMAFVRAATDEASPEFVPPDRRIATFDNDGTLWVEQPIYT